MPINPTIGANLGTLEGAGQQIADLARRVGRIEANAGRLDSNAVGSISTTLGSGAGLYESPTGTFNVGAADSTITVAASDIAVNTAVIATRAYADAAAASIAAGDGISESPSGTFNVDSTVARRNATNTFTQDQTFNNPGWFEYAQGSVRIGNTHAKALGHDYIYFYNATDGLDWAMWRPAATRDFRLWSSASGDVLQVTHAGDMTLAPPVNLQLAPGGDISANSNRIYSLGAAVTGSDAARFDQITAANAGALSNPLPEGAWINSTGAEPRLYLEDAAKTILNGATGVTLRTLGTTRLDTTTTGVDIYGVGTVTGQFRIANNIWHQSHNDSQDRLYFALNGDNYFNAAAGTSTHIRDGHADRMVVGPTGTTSYTTLTLSGASAASRVNFFDSTGGNLWSNVYAGGNGYLRTDWDFIVGGSIWVGGATDTYIQRTAAFKLKTNATLFQVGATAPVSSALVSAVANGDGYEFGHTNAAGYRGTLGSQSSGGRNFLAFHGEHGTNIDTFRTRGNKASLMRGDLLGGFQFGTVASASADNQTATWHTALSDGSLTLTSTVEHGSSSSGFRHFFAWDSSWQYRHGIYSIHNSGVAASNELRFYMWAPPTTAGADPTIEALRLTGDGQTWAKGQLKIGAAGRNWYDNGSSMTTNSDLYTTAGGFITGNLTVDYGNTGSVLAFGSTGGLYFTKLATGVLGMLGTLRMTASGIQIPNGQSYQVLNAAGSAYLPTTSIDGSNNLILGSPTNPAQISHVASGGIYTFRFNSVDKAYVAANYIYAPDGYLQGGRASTGEAAYLGGTAFFGPPGNAGPWDTNLYRVAANALKTDDAFAAASLDTGGTLTVGSYIFTNSYFQSRQAGGNVALYVTITGEANHRLRIDQDGKINWGAGAGATDTTLWRNAAGSLATGSQFLIQHATAPNLAWWNIGWGAGGGADAALNTSGSLVWSQTNVANRFFMDFPTGAFTATTLTATNRSLPSYNYGFNDDFGGDFFKVVPYAQPGDDLAWMVPYTAEKWNGTTYVAFSGGLATMSAWKALTDNSGSQIAIPASEFSSTKKFRLWYGTGGSIGWQNYIPVLTQLWDAATGTVQIEKSSVSNFASDVVNLGTFNFNTSYTNVLGKLNTADGRAYIRFTFTVTAWPTNDATKWTLINLKLNHWRPDSGNQFMHTLPFTWDQDRNVYMADGNKLFMRGGEAVAGYDGYLRLASSTGTFTSGVYTPGALRADGTVTMGHSLWHKDSGSSGSNAERLYFSANSNTYLKSHNGSVILRAGSDTDLYQFSSTQFLSAMPIRGTNYVQAEGAATPIFALRSSSGGNGINLYANSSDTFAVSRSGVGDYVYFSTGALAPASHLTYNLGTGTNYFGMAYLNAIDVYNSGNTRFIMNGTTAAFSNGPLSMTNQKITNLAAATTLGDAVRFEQYAIAGANLVINSSFEGGETVGGTIPNWSTGGGTATMSEDISRFGSRAAKAVSAASGGAGTYPGVYQWVVLGVRAGGTYTLSGYATAAATGNTDPWYIGYTFLDASNVALETSPGVTTLYVNGGALTSTWQRPAALTRTAPTGTAKIQVQPFFTSSGNSKVAYFDGIQLEENDMVTGYAPKPNEIVDGQIVAAMIKANAIIAGKIDAGAITSDIVTARYSISTRVGGTGAGVTVDNLGLRLYNASNVVVGSMLNADGIAKFTGGVFQTATAAPRVAMDNTGVFYESSTGVKDVFLTTSGLDILSGTSATPPAERKLRWLSSGTTTTELYAYEFGNYNVGGYTTTARNSSLNAQTYVAALGTGSRLAQLDMNAGEGSGGIASVELLSFWGNNAALRLRHTAASTCYVEAQAGINTKKIIGSDGASDYAFKTGTNTAIPCCRVYNTADITVGTAGALTFDSERYDTGGLHSTASDQGRLTATRSGVWRIFACVLVDTNTASDTWAYVGLRVNGTTYIGYEQNTSNAAIANPYFMVSTEYYLNSGDYVEVIAGAGNAGAKAKAFGNYTPEAGMSWVST